MLLTDVACSYFLASFLVKHIDMVLPNRRDKPDHSSNHNCAGLLSPDRLEFFWGNLFLLKDPLINQTQTDYMPLPAVMVICMGFVEWSSKKIFACF